jgi:hypothetical protein
MEKDGTYHPSGSVYEAMMLCRQGSSNLKRSQPNVNDAEGLPWPLQVPWSGSFITSQNPSRDLVAHGIFATMEVNLVKGYREKMILNHYEVGNLRHTIAQVLSFYLDANDEYHFADGIEVPVSYSGDALETLAKVLLDEQLVVSYTKYNSEVEEIIKCCAKQSAMLAHPKGDLDSHVVRKAFSDFITVSGTPFRWPAWLNYNNYRRSPITSRGLLIWRKGGLNWMSILMTLNTTAKKFGRLNPLTSMSCEILGGLFQ